MSYFHQFSPFNSFFVALLFRVFCDSFMKKLQFSRLIFHSVQSLYCLLRSFPSLFWLNVSFLSESFSTHLLFVSESFPTHSFIPSESYLTPCIFLPSLSWPFASFLQVFSDTFAFLLPDSLVTWFEFFLDSIFVIVLRHDICLSFIWAHLFRLLRASLGSWLHSSFVLAHLIFCFEPLGSWLLPVELYLSSFPLLLRASLGSWLHSSFVLAHLIFCFEPLGSWLLPVELYLSSFPLLLRASLGSWLHSSFVLAHLIFCFEPLGSWLLPVELYLSSFLCCFEPHWVRGYIRASS